MPKELIYSKNFKLFKPYLLFFIVILSLGSFCLFIPLTNSQDFYLNTTAQSSSYTSNNLIKASPILVSLNQSYWLQKINKPIDPTHNTTTISNPSASTASNSTSTTTTQHYTQTTTTLLTPGEVIFKYAVSFLSLVIISLVAIVFAFYMRKKKNKN